MSWRGEWPLFPNGEDDGMRRRVEELVADFVNKTWEGVRLNVACNGMDMAAENAASSKAETEGA